MRCLNLYGDAVSMTWVILNQGGKTIEVLKKEWDFNVYEATFLTFCISL